VIYHIDVYQGKNACNVGIEEQCWNLPTTMKAVVNAVMQSKLYFGSNEVQGYRVLSLDNRYQCPQLAYLLWQRYVYVSVVRDALFSKITSRNLSCSIFVSFFLAGITFCWLVHVVQEESDGQSRYSTGERRRGIVVCIRWHIVKKEGSQRTNGQTQE
jgi:hypothetical protein